MTQPKIIVLGALLLAAALPAARAQQTQTDELLVLNIQLNTVSQGTVTTTTARNVVQNPVIMSQITTRDVIQAIGGVTGNSFSRRAQLVLLTPTNDLNNWTVQIRDGTNAVDVSGFFGHQVSSPSVSSDTVNTRTGAVRDASYSLDSFTLQNLPQLLPLPFQFSVSGLTLTTESGVVRRGQVVGQVDSISGQVSGMGNFQGNLILIQGSISAQGDSTVPAPAPPPITLPVS